MEAYNIFRNVSKLLIMLNLIYSICSNYHNNVESYPTYKNFGYHI